MATSTLETLMGAVTTQLEAQISGIVVVDRVDLANVEPRGVADGATAVVHIGDEVDDAYTTRQDSQVRVTDTLEVQTVWHLDPAAQLTTRDALLARARAIREALTGSWGDHNIRRMAYVGSEGPTVHPDSTGWILVTQTFEASRFASLGAP